MEFKDYYKVLGVKRTASDDDIKKLSADITAGEKNPVVAARKLYDWTLQNVDYWVKYPDKFKASGIGSTEYCLRSRTGN